MIDYYYYRGYLHCEACIFHKMHQGSCNLSGLPSQGMPMHLVEEYNC